MSAILASLEAWRVLAVINENVIDGFTGTPRTHLINACPLWPEQELIRHGLYGRNAIYLAFDDMTPSGRPSRVQDITRTIFYCYYNLIIPN